MAVAHELDVNTDDPKKAVHAVKERVRKAKLKFPGGAAAATAAPAGASIRSVPTRRALPNRVWLLGARHLPPRKGPRSQSRRRRRQRVQRPKHSVDRSLDEYILEDFDIQKRGVWHSVRLALAMV